MISLVQDDLPQSGRLRELRNRLHATETLCRSVGQVVRVTGLTIESTGPQVAIGDHCQIRTTEGRDILVEVVGFRDQRLILMPLASTEGLAPGLEVVGLGHRYPVPRAAALPGRVIDGLGQPMDGLGPIAMALADNVGSRIPNPLRRQRIQAPLSTGIKALDTFVPLGQGQRLGIFAGSGVGKSTLLGMMAGKSDADVNVVALIGERGREVREFIETDLDEAGRRKSIVVVATADQPALVRVKAAMLAMSLAEQLRDEGRNVLLMMDSVTRFAMAQREIGLAVGEPPTARGYTPSVFARLPQLLERAGNGEQGSITGIFTVLVEGDDLNDPVVDATRSILDGHLVLTRELADRNHWPAIEVLQSVSRLTRDLLTPDQLALQGRARELLAIHRQNRDLLSVGAYARGTNPRLDEALAALPALESMLRQGRTEAFSRKEAWDQLAQACKAPATATTPPNSPATPSPRPNAESPSMPFHRPGPGNMAR